MNAASMASVRLSIVVMGIVCWARLGIAHARPNVWTNEGPQGADVSTIAIDPTDAQTVYVGTNGGGVFKTTDGGTTWVAARDGLTGGAVREIDIDPNDTQTLYARSQRTDDSLHPGGLFKSTNGGSTWDATDQGLGDVDISAVVIDGRSPGTIYAAVGDTNQGGIFKSTDGGQIWNPILQPAAGPDRDVRRIGLHPSDSQIIYVATRVQLLKTINGGQDWTPAGSGLPFFGNDRVVEFAFDPVDIDTVYAGGFGGPHPSAVYKTTNGGDSWDPTGGEVGIAVKRVVAHPSQAGTLYALHSEGVYKTTDYGAHWQLMIANLPPRKFGYDALDLARSDPQRLYLGMGPGAPVPAYRSLDGAATWAPLPVKGLTNVFLTSLAVDPVDPLVRYVTADIASIDDVLPLLKGGNDPESWVRSDNISNARIVVINPVDTNILYAGSANDGVFKSTDAGAMWKRSNLGISATFIRCLTLDPRDPKTLYACVYPTLYKSPNSGAAWDPIGDDLRDEGAAQAAIPTAVVIDPLTSMTVYVTTDGQGVFKSIDGAATWHSADQGMRSARIQSVAIDPVDPRIVYAGAFVPLGASVPGGVDKSIDGGASWLPANGGEDQLISKADVRVLAVDGACPQILYAATNFGVFRSIDGAATWTLVDDGLFAPDVRALVIDPLDPSQLHAATFGGGVFSIEQSFRSVGACPATPTPVTSSPTPTPTVVPATPTLGPAGCIGDCDGSGSVRVDELVRAVRIALDLAPANDCFAVDADHDGHVRINELVQAVQRSLSGC